MKKTTKKNKTQNSELRRQKTVATKPCTLNPIPYTLSAASLKLLAFEGKSIAECETLLSEELKVKSEKLNKKKKSKTNHSSLCTINLNEIFEKDARLKASWERGRFLRALADLAESNLTIVEVEAEMKKNHFLKPDDQLQQIFTDDNEVSDTFNQARHKHIIEVQRIIKDNLHKASPAAIRAYKALFSNPSATQAEFSRVTTKQMMDMTGYSRQMLEYEGPKKYSLPRNSDGSFNLAVFIPWLMEHIKNTRQGVKVTEPETLRNKKAEMLDIELKERLGSLLPRDAVMAGILGRHQLMLAMFDKFIEKVPGLAENQPIERIRQVLIDSFIEIRNEMAKAKIELKLNDEQQAEFVRFLNGL
jgi:hypothetical protein